MYKKLRHALQGQGGMAIILVLCLGSLFVALAAALGYAASVMAANTNSQLQEQQAYQLAVSYSEVLEQELQNSSSEFAMFVNNTYMTSESYGLDVYNQPSPKTTFACTPNADTGADELEVTLQRRPVEPDDSWQKKTLSYSSADDLESQIVQLEQAHIADFQLDITVTAKKGKAQYAYTVTYTRTALYKNSMYYTIDNQTLLFYHTQVKTFQDANHTRTIYFSDNGPSVTLHYDTTIPPTDFAYARDVKQAAAKGDANG